jgi:hypothetical protein
MQEEFFPIVLPAYPMCERCVKDMHEKLYRISDRRYVLVSEGIQTTLSRAEAIEWLKSRKMSRATMY